MPSKIPYSLPSITQKEVAYATDAAENGWGPKCYEYIDRFELLFAKHLGVKHAIATSSCTGAIHMGLSALGIGPGDEVIMGDTNWIASAAPVTTSNAVAGSCSSWTSAGTASEPATCRPCTADLLAA